MYKLVNWLVIMSVYIVFNAGSAYAQTEVVFGPEDAQLNASIRYTVIGVYNAQFEDYKGRILFKPNTQEPQSVDLSITAKTITSSCGWCDEIVRSERLLDVGNFPEINFTSQKIYKDADGYKVEGDLSLHGVTKDYTFPFMIARNASSEAGDKRVVISGNWEIDRKEFGVVWNQYLDKGGVLVGNIITVDWEITTQIN